MTAASVVLILSTNSFSDNVPVKMVRILSPQVIGKPVAVQAADIPVIAGTTSIGTSKRSLS